MNPTPNFIMRSLKVKRARTIGNGNHTKFVLEHNGKTIDALMFNKSYLNLNISENDIVDVMFTMDINSFNNIENVQIVIQAIRHSQEYLSYFSNETELYYQIRNGAKFTVSDNIIPTREDFVNVYLLLKKEFRLGNDIMTEVDILKKLASPNNEIRLAKLKIILEILNELKICTVTEINKGLYQFDIYFNTEKTNIDKSSILKKIKNQCIKD